MTSPHKTFIDASVPLFSVDDFTKNLPSHPTLLSWLKENISEDVSGVSRVEMVRALPTATQAVFRVKIVYTVDGQVEDSEQKSEDTNSIFAFAKYASYDDFLDQIQDNLNEYYAFKVLHENMPDLLPEVIVAEVDAKQRQFFLLTVDMTQKGCKSLTLPDFANLHYVESLVKKMAALHAEFYGTEKDLPHSNLWIQNFESKQRVFRKRFEEGRNQEYPDHSYLSPEMKDVVDWTTQNMSEVFDEKLKRWPSSLMHTDVQFGNVLYHEEKDDFIFIDWPNMSFRSLLSELSYFLCWSLETKTLEKEEDKFLALYQKTFIEEMEKRNKEVPRQMRDMATVKQMYIVNLLELPVHLPLFFELQFDTTPKEMITFFNEMFGRIFHCVFRLDAVNVAKEFLRQSIESKEE